MDSLPFMGNGTYAHFHDTSAHRDDFFLTRKLGPYSVLDAVFDGLTWGSGGSFASRSAAAKLREGKISSVDDVVQSLQAVNDELFNSGRISYTTATVALKLGNELFVVNVGDSPAFLIRDGAVIELATLDRIAANSTMVQSSVGYNSSLADKLHHAHETLRPDDRLVLATDGVTDNLYLKEIAGIVHDKRTPRQAMAALVQLLEKKRQSNEGRRYGSGEFRIDDATVILRYFPPN